MEKPKPIAKVMLKVAMDHAREAMRPWTATDGDADELMKQFTKDFNTIFDDNPKPETHPLWADRIKRLFTSVGGAAALIAESRQTGVKDPPGPVGMEDLRFAIKVVEIAICPQFPERARACNFVPDLDDEELERKLIAYVKHLYLIYQQWKGLASKPSAP